MNGCRFCQLDENGDCTCVVLECRDTGEKIKLFFAESRVTVTIDHENPTRMFYPIYYCPMCGSKIREKEA